MLAALTRLQGRFRQVLLVTHNDEVKDLLPAAIEVRKGPDRSSVGGAAGLSQGPVPGRLPRCVPQSGIPYCADLCARRVCQPRALEQPPARMRCPGTPRTNQEGEHPVAEAEEEEEGQVEASLKS